MKNLTLIIPAKNEAESLPQVLEEIKLYDCKKIVVLEETDFDTINSIKDYDCEIIFQKINGYGSAITEGVQSAKTDYACIFNADGSFDPKDLKPMYDELLDNHDFIFASRYEKNSGSDDDTFLTYFGNKFFSLLTYLLFSISLTDILYTYVLFKKKKFENLKIKSSDFQLCVEMPIKAKIMSMKLKSYGSFERKRIAGKKKVNEFKDGFLILYKIIKIFLKKNNDI